MAKANPMCHVRIDGSVGILPRYYTVRNTVTRIVQDRLLEWAPALAGKGPSGRVYGWQIEPVGEE